MNTISKILAGASLAAAAMTALPASAQVTGAIGVVGAPGVVASTNAFRTAYQQIGTTYQAQTTQIQQKNQQAQTLLQQLDTNNDGNLDEAEQRAAQTAPQAQQIIITLDADGQVFLNKQPSSFEQLEEQLRELLSESENRVVTIRADQQMTYDHFVRALDIAKRSGAEHVNIAHTTDE